MTTLLDKIIKLSDEELVYSLRTDSRVKNLRITVSPDGTVVVSRPRRISERVVEQFIHAQIGWIKNKLAYFKNQKPALIHPLDTLTRRDYLREREATRQLVLERLHYFNNFYKFSFKSVSIRNQKTRWGSCSTRGSLSFNFRLGRLPANLRDYIIVHELCHLKELNHSIRFWNLVEKLIPDYKILRKQLINKQF